MAANQQDLRQSIVDVGRLIFEKGWIAATDGNISIRLDEQWILSTPAGISKGTMTPADLVVCDMDGHVVSGGLHCTSEIAMHTAIYRLRADVASVVHAHPPVSTGFAAAGRALDQAILPEVITSLGCVPLAPYGLPGTPEVTAGMLPLIPRFDAILMANHGLVCYGEDVHKAYARMEKVEQCAQITLVAELLGGPKLLPRAEVRRLFESRARYGITARTTFEPGCPVAAEDQAAERPTYRVTRDDLVAIVDEALRARGHRE